MNCEGEVCIIKIKQCWASLLLFTFRPTQGGTYPPAYVLIGHAQLQWCWCGLRAAAHVAVQIALAVCATCTCCLFVLFHSLNALNATE